MSTSIPRVVADFETSLDASVSEGDITATLSAIIDTDGVTLANGYYGFTIDNETEYKEFILATLNGTALTNVFSVSDQGVATTGFNTYHSRGAVVQITDHVSLLKVVQTLTSQIGIDSGTPLRYDSTPTLNNGLQLATVQYVLDHVNGGAITLQNESIQGTTGELISNNSWVYLDETQGLWYLTNASNKAKSVGVKIGYVGTGAAAFSMVNIKIHGSVSSIGFTDVVNYLSNTPGQISTTPGTNVVSVGYCDDNANLFIGIVPSSYQDALAGSSGTPSSSNKFLTQESASASGTDQSQVTQNGTYSAGEANTTTRHNKLAQSFIPVKNQIKGVNLYKAANTGTFTGTVTIALQADSSGSPSGVNLVSKTITNTLYNAYATGDFLALFTTDTVVTPGSLYWIVISTSTADVANCINLGTNTGGGYANGSAKYNNTTDGWVLIPTIDLYFKTIEGSTGKEIIANSSGYVPTTSSKLVTKIGTVTLAAAANTTIIHGMGKMPALVRASVGAGSNGQGSWSAGVYDVSSSTYAENYFAYNEATGGGNGPNSDRILTLAINNTGTGTALTVVGVDENILIFSNGGGLTQGITYELIG